MQYGNDDDDNIVVAIWMVTYNQEKHITQAVESILSQETSFKYRLFIGEDNSTDNTRKLCISYKEKYPEKIELILQEKNIGAVNNAQTVYKACFESGARYIAMCEGDDYWTDTYKLQKQVDFLALNPEFSMCFHNVFNFYEATSQKELFIKKELPTKIDTQYLIENAWTIPTCSMVFRNTLKNIPDWLKRIKHGDYALQLILSNYGFFYYHNEVRAVYRLHPKGISNEFHQEKNLGIIKILNFFNSETKGKYRSWIKTRNSDLYLEQALVEKHFSRPYSNNLLLSLQLNPLNFFSNFKKILRVIIPKKLKKIMKK